MSRHRQDAAPKAIRKFCPQCRYTLVHLRDFTGASSLDAPKSEVYGAYETSRIGQFGLTGLIIRLLIDAAGGLSRGNQAAKRRTQIKHLRDDILPADPMARVCPHCLHLVLSDE